MKKISLLLVALTAIFMISCGGKDQGIKPETNPAEILEEKAVVQPENADTKTVEGDETEVSVEKTDAKAAVDETDAKAVEDDCTCVVPDE